MKAEVLASLLLTSLLVVDTVYASTCTRDSDCPGAGQVCRLYEGCPAHRGTCICRPGTHIEAYENGRYVCKKLVAADGRCSSADVCGAGMACREGTCHCHTETMTSDKLLCYNTHTSLLGESCRPGHDRCYQKQVDGSGYTSDGVECSSRDRQCRCRDNYKQDGLICRRYNLYETGCTENYHCQMNAFCISGRCTCVSGFRAADGGLCVKNGAITNIPLGGRCDEANQKRYCGRGLMCYGCQSNSHSVCVRASPSEGNLLSAGTSTGLSPLLLVLSAILVAMVTRHGLWWCSSHDAASHQSMPTTVTSSAANLR